MNKKELQAEVKRLTARNVAMMQKYENTFIALEANQEIVLQKEEMIKKQDNRIEELQKRLKSWERAYDVACERAKDAESRYNDMRRSYDIAMKTATKFEMATDHLVEALKNVIDANNV